MNLTLRSILTLLVFTLVVSLSLIVIVSKRQTLFGWQLMAVRSGSMEPSIPVGSLILVKSETHYAQGDIVTYRNSENSGTLITHRIVGVDHSSGSSQYRMKGDNNPVVDQNAVNLTQILGKVQYFVPLLGFLFTFLQTPVGLVVFILIPGTVLVYEEIKSLYRQMHKLFVKPQLFLIWITLSAVTITIVPTWAIYAANTQLQNATFQTGQWVNPSLTLEQDEDNLLVKLNNPGGNDTVRYLVTYLHLVDGEPVNEAIEGELEVQAVDDVFTLPAFFIGTCSTDETCTAHDQVSALQIELELKKDTVITETLLSDFAWE